MLGACPRGHSLKGSQLSLALALSTGVRLSWKGLPWTITLAYLPICKLRLLYKFYIGPWSKNDFKGVRRH